MSVLIISNSASEPQPANPWVLIRAPCLPCFKILYSLLCISHFLCQIKQARVFSLQDGGQKAVKTFCELSLSDFNEQQQQKKSIGKSCWFGKYREEVYKAPEQLVSRVLCVFQMQNWGSCGKCYGPNCRRLGTGQVEFQRNMESISQCNC